MSIFDKFKHKLHGDTHLRELLSGSSITFLFKIAGMLFGYILIYLISKENGAKGVGFYNLFVKTITVLGTFVGLGLNIATLRYVGQFNNKINQSKMYLLYSYILKLIFPLSIFFGLVIYFNAYKIIELLRKTSDYTIYLKLIGIALPFFALNLINIEFIRGLKKLQLSELIRSVTRPALMVVFILIWKTGYTFNILDVIYLFIVGVLLNWTISSIFIWKKLKSIDKSRFNSFSIKELINTSLPMMVTSISTILLISFPIFFLDFFTTQKEIGIFSVTFKIAMLISIVLVIVNTIVAPKFSELFWGGKKEELQKLINQSVKIMFWTAFIISIIVIIGADFILGIFGDEFKEGRLILIILVIGQLINASCGSVGVLMNMSGEQKILQKINLVIVIISFFAYLFLIPTYGLIGCAFVYFFGLILKNITGVIYVKRKLKLTTFFNPFSKNKL